MNQAILDKVDTFFTKHKHHEYKKGELLIRADDDPSGIFYLKQGQVKEYAISQKGNELVINIFKPVAFFPMSWAINETPNNYFFEAVTDVEVWKAPKKEIVAFIKDNPDVLFDLMSRVYKGTDGILTRMTYLMAGNAYARLTTELLIQAKRFGKHHENSVTLQISEKDLAAESGMTRETVSREIHKLKKKELITFSRNTLVIADIQKLEDELADDF